MAKTNSPRNTVRFEDSAHFKPNEAYFFVYYSSTVFSRGPSVGISRVIAKYQSSSVVV